MTTVRDAFPLSVGDGGPITFASLTPDPAAEAAARAMAALVNRLVGDVVDAQDAAVTAALLDAEELGCGIRLQRPPWGRQLVAADTRFVPYRFIGLEVSPDVPARTIHEHVAGFPVGWEED